MNDFLALMGRIVRTYVAHHEPDFLAHPEWYLEDRVWLDSLLSGWWILDDTAGWRWWLGVYTRCPAGQNLWDFSFPHCKLDAPLWEGRFHHPNRRVARYLGHWAYVDKSEEAATPRTDPTPWRWIDTDTLVRDEPREARTLTDRELQLVSSLQL